MNGIGYENQDSENAGKGVCLDHVVTKKYGWGGGEDDADQWELSWFLGSRMHDGMIAGWWK